MIHYPSFVHAKNIYEKAPFPSCHASTLAETPAGIVCAFFGGTHERHEDVEIWFSEFDGKLWSPPRSISHGIQPDGKRYPCWNPVLFQVKDGPLILFHKVGPSPVEWWGEILYSFDRGKTWTKKKRMGKGLNGPSKNKPVQLPNGDIICGCSLEDPNAGWQISFERSTDGGKTFTPGDFVARGDIPKATQPTILIHSPTRLQALGRTTIGGIFQTWSNDAGKTWSPLELTTLPNCNSGIDAVTLKDGRHLLAYNHSNIEKVRYPLCIAMTEDGTNWQAVTELETAPPGQYSYPSIIQSSDGLVHVAYTFLRKTIKHVILDPKKFEPKPISTFQCPPAGSITHRIDPTQ